MNYERSYVLYDVQYVYRQQTECHANIYEIFCILEEDEVIYSLGIMQWIAYLCSSHRVSHPLTSDTCLPS